MKKLIFLLLFASFSANAGGLIAVVEHDEDSVILRFPIYDAAAPLECASDITETTTGFAINVSSDNSDGYIDQFRETDNTLEGITTIGTFATPSANNARFEIIATGSCIYELQMPNSIFATSGATQINIEITDGATALVDDYFWVDLTRVTTATFIDALLDTSCTSYATVSDVGYQLCTVANAINTLLSTVDGNVDDAVTNSSRGFLYSAPVTAVGGSNDEFTVDGGNDPGAATAHEFRFMCIVDVSASSPTQDCRKIESFNTSTEVWTLSGAPFFTVEVGDLLFIPVPAANWPSF